MVPDAPSDEHPNVRRARFEALARDELVEPLRHLLAEQTDPDTADAVLAETLLVCWQRLDDIPDPALPWAADVAQRALDAKGVAVRRGGGSQDPDTGPAPADPAWVSRLLADVVSEHTETESRRTGTRGRSRLTWVVAVAALLLIVVAAAYAALRDPGPVSDGAPDSAPAVTTVSLPGGGAGQRCAMPSAEALRRADLAFDGEVSQVTGSTATLVPSRVYTGERADQVRVVRASPSRVSLILGVRFEEGGRYLVAVSGDDVMVCGFSGAYDAERAELYGEAFGA